MEFTCVQDEDGSSKVFGLCASADEAVAFELGNILKTKTRVELGLEGVAVKTLTMASAELLVTLLEDHSMCVWKVSPSQGAFQLEKRMNWDSEREDFLKTHSENHLKLKVDPASRDSSESFSAKLRFSNDGQLLIAQTSDGKLTIFNVAMWSIFSILNVGDVKIDDFLVFSNEILESQGVRLIALVTRSRKTIFVEIDSEGKVTEVHAQNRQVEKQVVAIDGNMLTSVCADGKIRVSDVNQLWGFLKGQTESAGELAAVKVEVRSP